MILLQLIKRTWNNFLYTKTEIKFSVSHVLLSTFVKNFTCFLSSPFSSSLYHLTIGNREYVSGNNCFFRKTIKTFLDLKVHSTYCSFGSVRNSNLIVD